MNEKFIELIKNKSYNYNTNLYFLLMKNKLKKYKIKKST